MSQMLQVTTEYLLDKKEEWKGVLQQMTSTMNTVLETVNSLDDCFFAEGVKAFERGYGRDQEEAVLCMQGLKEQIEKLKEIAVVYGEIERSNQIEIGKN